MRRLHVHGEVYIALESIAECYEVEISFVRECYEHGFLGRGVKVERSIAIPAARLDRVAEVVRLHRHMGLDFDAIELWFETAG